MTLPDRRVIWHDVECGGYAADLPVWRALAAKVAGAVLDVGAGTGRVALDLARAGHEVVALDREDVLLAALRERAGDRAVATVQADARSFVLDARFALVIVPMQTLQLLGDGRRDFLRAAQRHLEPGGRLAAALAEPLLFEAAGPALPGPDILRLEGWSFVSQPTAAREAPGGVALERLRETLRPDGRRTLEHDVVVLSHTSAADVAEEGARLGLQPLVPIEIEQTDEHVATTIALLRA